MNSLKEALGLPNCAPDANGRNQGWCYSSVHAAVRRIFGTVPGEIMAKVTAEIKRANEKHGDFPKDLMLRVCIVAEEMGEVQKAVVNYKLAGASIEDVDKEMIQLAAMALKFLVSRRLDV
jgi:hypothetical protein